MKYGDEVHDFELEAMVGDEASDHFVVQRIPFCVFIQKIIFLTVHQRSLNLTRLAKHSAFIIDKNGKIRKIFRDMDAENPGHRE